MTLLRLLLQVKLELGNLRKAAIGSSASVENQFPVLDFGCVDYFSVLLQVFGSSRFLERLTGTTASPSCAVFAYSLDNYLY